MERLTFSTPGEVYKFLGCYLPVWIIGIAVETKSFKYQKHGIVYMAGQVCPHWVGYLLINPLRKLFEKPNKILGPFVQEGMIVLEPGCGMGYFTLPLARMVGPTGRIIAVDIQPKMLSALRRRAQKSGLLDRIELRHIREDGLGVKDISEKVDFAVALHVVHEVPDQASFFTEVWQTLKQGSKLLFVEPKGHVSQDQFAASVDVAENVGFVSEVLSKKMSGRVALLIKKIN